MWGNLKVDINKKVLVGSVCWNVFMSVSNICTFCTSGQNRGKLRTALHVLLHLYIHIRASISSGTRLCRCAPQLLPAGRNHVEDHVFHCIFCLAVCREQTCSKNKTLWRHQVFFPALKVNTLPAPAVRCKRHKAAAGAVPSSVFTRRVYLWWRHAGVSTGPAHDNGLQRVSGRKM